MTEITLEGGPLDGRRVILRHGNRLRVRVLGYRDDGTPVFADVDYVPSGRVAGDGAAIWIPLVEH